MKLARALIAIGSLLLLLTVLLHSYGYVQVAPKVAASNLPAALQGAFKALWWVLSVTGILLCPLILWASRIPNGRGLVLLATAIPVLMTLVTLLFVGVFVGSIGLGLSSLFLLAGGSLLPGTSHA